MRDDIIRRAGDVETGLARLALSLYTAESSSELAFVRSQKDVGGTTGPVASGLVRALDEVWMHYPVAREWVQHIVTTARSARWDEADRLLGPEAISLPTGAATGASDLLETLQGQLDRAAEGAARLAEQARRALATLDAAAATFAGLVERAAALGADHDVEVVEARRWLDRAVAAVAADPTVEPPARLAGAVDAVRRRVELLERQQETLPAALAAARSQLDEIRRVVTSGAEARAEARMKVGSTTGRCEPLDPGGLDRGDRALQPWLIRIEEQAAAGQWPAAAAGLEQWQQLAGTWLTSAHHVLTTNRRPLDRRNELRGLLQACEAKAAAAGRAEEPGLIGLRRAADDAVYVAPCDLAVAEARVRAYVTAVGSDPSEDRP